MALNRVWGEPLTFSSPPPPSSGPEGPAAPICNWEPRFPRSLHSSRNLSVSTSRPRLMKTVKKGEAGRGPPLKKLFTALCWLSPEQGLTSDRPVEEHPNYLLWKQLLAQCVEGDKLPSEKPGFNETFSNKHDLTDELKIRNHHCTGPKRGHARQLPSGRITPQ